MACCSCSETCWRWSRMASTGFRSTTKPPVTRIRWTNDCICCSASSYSAFSSMAFRSKGSTLGMRLWASGRVKRFGMLGLDAGHLHGHGSAARPVELSQNNALPGPQKDHRIAHLQTEALPHDHATQVRVGIFAFAIGIFRVIMPPGILAVNQIVQKVLDVVQQCVLPFIDEDGCRGMQRLQVHDAVANPALAHDLVDSIGDVDQLHALVGDPIHHTIEDFDSAALLCFDFHEFLLDGPHGAPLFPFNWRSVPTRSR